MFDDEAAFGPNRDNDRVLDGLRLHQSQNLDAEIFTTIRPSQTAARNFSAAKMHSLHSWRVDPYLIHGTGLGQAFERA